MPFKKFRKSRRRKQSAWQRKRSMASQPRAAIADTQLVRMRYGDIVQLNPGAGTSATHVFSANSTFDPNKTGTGHQPLGHDEWANFYNHITVIGSKIKVTYASRGSSAPTSSALCAISVKGTNAIVSGPITPLLEQTGVVWGLMTASNASGKMVLRKHFSTKKFFNKGSVKDAEELKGTFGTNPLDQAYYHLVVASQDSGDTDVGAVDLIVEIEYICLLSERKVLVQS